MASKKACELFDQYLVSRDWLERVVREERDNLEGNERVIAANKKRRKARRALMNYITELETKTKWRTGHPEHSGEVLLYVKFYAYGGDAFLGYTVDEWDFQLERWVSDEFNHNVLGWKEIESFDLPIEPSETIGHLEEEE